MKPNFPFVEGQRGNSLFWVKDRLQEVSWTHMDPVNDDPVIFWNRYIDYVLHTNRQLPQHIQYRADSQKCKHSWQSGLIIDSDINLTIGIATLQRLIDCGECQDPLECEKCKNFRKNLQDRFNAASNKARFVYDFLQRHPYEPSTMEISTIAAMVREMQNFVKTYCQLPTNDKDEVKQLLQPIIMLKYNAIPIDDVNSNDGKDSTEFQYRYGYHIYFFNIKCDGQAKYFISRQKFSANLLQQISRTWPNSSPSQVFDTQPLKGSTSLPLSGPESKRYTRVLAIDFDNNNEYEIIDNILQPQMRNQYLEALNPFAGETITLKAQYIQVRESTASITEYFERKHYQSYLQALKFTKVDNKISVFTSNSSLNQMMTTYGHPDYNIRFSLVSYLYQYIKEKSGTSVRDDDVVLATKLIFFIMLATKDDIAAAMELKDIVGDNNWMQAHKDRNRYPINIDSFVNSVLQALEEKQNSQKQQHVRTAEELWLLMFDIFNKFKKQSNQEDDIINAAPESSYSFGDFIEQIQTDKMYQGVYSGDKYIYRLVSQHSAEVAQLVCNYIYLKMHQQLYVDNNETRTLYMFESKDTNQTDYNKYHIVSEQLVNALNSIAFEQLTAGIYAGMSIAEREGRQQYIEVQKKGTDETVEVSYFNAWLTGKQCADDEDYKAYVAKMRMFSDVLQIFSKNRQQYEKGSIFTSRLIIGKLKEYQLMGDKAPVIDQEVNYIGVYNGIIQYLPNANGKPCIKFLYGDTCKTHYVSRSMLCNIRAEFLDADDCLVEPDRLPTELRVIYDDINNVAKGIYGKGRDMYILQWKIYQIVARMFQKTYTADKLFIAYGTGSDGKTTFMQAICNVLGTSGFKKTVDQQTRAISSNGYASIAKSSVLQTADKNAQGHDSGGMSELYGNFFQLCSELQQTMPLCVSTIKQLLCGTQISSRKAYDINVKSFQNTCFMELQTNYYPAFDQSFDVGTIRRILFYKHCIKFVSQEEYDRMDNEQRLSHMVADPTIQQRFFNNWDYVDVMGYYLLTQFLHYENRDIAYVPPKLIKDTLQFFDTQCRYLCELLNEIRPDYTVITAWSYIEEFTRDFLMQKGKRNKITQIEIDSHLERLRETLKDYIYGYNKQKNLLHRVSDNDFMEQSTKKDEIIVVIGYKMFSPDAFQEAKGYLANVNMDALWGCVRKMHNYNAKTIQKKEEHKEQEESREKLTESVERAEGDEEEYYETETESDVSEID